MSSITLNRLYSLRPSYDIKVLLGDFNAKLCRESVGSASVGKHSLHEVSTDNGRRLAFWATSRGLVIRVANRVIGRKKRNYERAELHDLENLRNRNEIRKFYKKLKGQIEGFKASNTSICYSKSRTLITNPGEVTKRLVEYFNDLMVSSKSLPIYQYSIPQLVVKQQMV